MISLHVVRAVLLLERNRFVLVVRHVEYKEEHGMAM